MPPCDMGRGGAVRQAARLGVMVGGMSGHDPDSPIQDADIEQADFQRESDREHRLRLRGICAHGWTQGFNAIHAAYLKPGQVKCLDCNKVFNSEAELQDERREVLE